MNTVGNIIILSILYLCVNLLIMVIIGCYSEWYLHRIGNTNKKYYCLFKKINNGEPSIVATGIVLGLPLFIVILITLSFKGIIDLIKCTINKEL